MPRAVAADDFPVLLARLAIPTPPKKATPEGCKGERKALARARRRETLPSGCAPPRTKKPRKGTRRLQGRAESPCSRPQARNPAPQAAVRRPAHKMPRKGTRRLQGRAESPCSRPQARNPAPPAAVRRPAHTPPARTTFEGCKGNRNALARAAGAEPPYQMLWIKYQAHTNL